MTSPAHRQYLSIKERYSDAVLLFRMGDFYEMFGEDAEIGSRALGITLTSREFARGDRVPMCGIPHHALQQYLRRFLDAGLKVAICEQLSEPGKGLVERDVVRVVTPGTLVEDALLNPRENNYLVAVNPEPDALGLAYVDVTTGEFALTELRGADAPIALETELLRLHPSEILIPREDERIPSVGLVSTWDDWRFDADSAREALCRHFQVRSLEGFGADDVPAALGAAGAIVGYIERTNRSLLGLLTRMRTYHVSSFMTLDRYTRRSLELTETARAGGVRGSLLSVLDRTHTAMGGRQLRAVLGRPLLDPVQLNHRLDAVAELVALPVVRAQIRSALMKIADLERISGRVRQGLASARDLLSLRDSLRCVPDVRVLLEDAQGEELRALRDQMDPCDDVVGLIESAVDDSDDARLIREGYSRELDEMIAGIRDAREWMASLEGIERERTGIRSLKVGYNKVFGYYIEVSNANVHLAPQEYVRKQTLVNAERFVTPELKEYEARILQAEDRIDALERRLFVELLAKVDANADRVFATATALSALDVHRGLADLAAQNNYCRPELDLSDRIEIVAGRHPVVEISLDDAGFIPNDLCLDTEERQVLVITGPNMGGKSTYLRQSALIALMAQIGSFVPADSAHIGVVDRIFSRVGAQDDIAAGQSTFMVEMVETANILNHATQRSLLVLDEVGRGTSTYDGLAIARAVLEYVHDVIGARTLFATHYHELTGLADRLVRVHNVNVAVADDGDSVVFLHRVVAGGADRSYGIHVARLAGLPGNVIDRAQEALHDLEHTARMSSRRRRGSDAQQIPLFASSGGSAAERVLDELLAVDIATLTPLEALNLLDVLQQQGRGE